MTCEVVHHSHSLTAIYAPFLQNVLHRQQTLLQALGQFCDQRERNGPESISSPSTTTRERARDTYASA